MTHSYALALSALWLTFTFQALGISPQEQNLKRKKVPEAVIRAFELSYPKAKIKGYSKEADEGKIVYEVESKQGTAERDILYNPDGTVVSIEESLPFADLPQLVRDAIGNEFPKGKVIRCERLLKGSTTEFEVVVTHSKSKYEVMFEPNGKIIKKEKV